MAGGAAYRTAVAILRDMKITLALVATAAALLLAGCQSSPFKGPSQVPQDPEQEVIEGNGPADGGAVPMEIEDGEDVDQDPTVGAPM